MVTRIALAGGVLLGAALLASPAMSADPLKMGAPPSPRPTPLVPTPSPGAQQLPTPETRTFVEPLSRPTRSGRAGVAVWAAPGTSNSQRGPGDPDSVGWVGGGAAVEWGGGPRRSSPN